MALRDAAVDRLIRRGHLPPASTLDELRPAVRALDRVLRAQGVLGISQWSNQEHWVAGYWDMYGRPETIPPLPSGRRFLVRTTPKATPGSGPPAR